MSKMLSNGKENTTATFYQTGASFASQGHFSSTLRLFSNNSDSIDELAIELQSLEQRLKDRIVLEQSKTEGNYLLMQEIQSEIQAGKSIMGSDKEIEQIVKGKKQTIKSTLGPFQQKLAHVNRKNCHELKGLAQRFEFTRKEIQYEKQQREDEWSRLVDNFEREIVEKEGILKGLRKRDQQVFDERQIDIWRVQEEIGQCMDTEATTRKHEHETIVRLVSDCIESVRHIY